MLYPHALKGSRRKIIHCCVADLFQSHECFLYIIFPSTNPSHETYQTRITALKFLRRYYWRTAAFGIMMSCSLVHSVLHHNTRIRIFTAVLTLNCNITYFQYGEKQENLQEWQKFQKASAEN
jgi:hypothetical protein